MVDSARVRKVVDQLAELTAADMKLVAKFGKVKGYSQEYLDLKEALRSMVSIARNLYDIDLVEEFNAVEPIVFTGLIPNEVFNNERRRLMMIGERLAERLEGIIPLPESAGASRAERVSAASAAGAKPAASAAPAPVVGNPLIYVSTPSDPPVIGDLKRCLTTADCELVTPKGLRPSEADYTPRGAAEQLRACNGALICLVTPPFDRPSPKAGPSLTRVSDTGAEMDGAHKAPEAPKTGLFSAKPMDKPGGAKRGAAGETNLAVVQFDRAKTDPMEEENPDLVLARLAQNVLIELWIAVSHFPDRTFFVVEEGLVDLVPETMRDLISFKTSGAQLTFEEGQTLVQTFKKSSWTPAKS